MTPKRVPPLCVIALSELTVSTVAPRRIQLAPEPTRRNMTAQTRRTKLREARRSKHKRRDDGKCPGIATVRVKFQGAALERDALWRQTEFFSEKIVSAVLPARAELNLQRVQRTNKFRADLRASLLQRRSCAQTFARSFA